MKLTIAILVLLAVAGFFVSGCSQGDQSRDMSTGHSDIQAVAAHQPDQPGPGQGWADMYYDGDAD